MKNQNTDYALFFTKDIDTVTELFFENKDHLADSHYYNIEYFINQVVGKKV